MAATNEDLGRAVRNGRFREDLFFRLNVIELAVPKLSERREDILPLSVRFARAAALEAGVPVKPFRPETEAALLRYAWPGNVRELENRIRRAVLVSGDPALSPADLGLGSLAKTQDPGPALNAEDLAERDRIAAALDEADGVVADAARALGLSRQALYRRMHRLSIAVERVVDR